MTTPLKITIVTTSRADYGLLYPLIKELQQVDGFTVHLVATGSHLSILHGQTITQIHQDGLLPIPIAMTHSDDSEHGICTAIATGLTGFSQLLQQLQPDILLVLGDRYELWAVCIAAVIHKIPIAHLHGGESTQGAIDEAVRHSVTKMATFHFASTQAYANTILQMGESPACVFTVGALGIDNIRHLHPMTIQEISECTQVDFNRNQVALLTYHPVTLDDFQEAKLQLTEIFNAILTTHLCTIITMPNADTGSSTLFKVIQHHVQEYPDRFCLIKNLGQRAYLNAMRYAKLMIGNSSSGILESASFRLPVVNIGDRQAGRLKPLNVIDSPCSSEAIQTAIQTALSPDFAQLITNLVNPYGDGLTAPRIVSILQSLDLSQKSNLLKKQFCKLADLLH